MTLPLEFALEGFRILRRRPQLLAWWGGVSLLGYGLCCLIVVALLGPYQQIFVAATRQAPAEVAVSVVMAQKILTAFAALVPVYLCTTAILDCAICRAALEPQEDRLGYLRFGVRELQAMAVLLATGVMQFGLAFIVLVLWKSMRLGDAGDVVGAFLAGALALWIGTRLSLNVAQSFVGRRVDVFGSFALTRDKVSPLLAGYVMAFGLAMMINLLCEEIVTDVLTLAFGIQRDKFVPDVSSLAAFLKGPTITAMALTFGLVSPQMRAIMFGASVAAYRGMRPALSADTVRSTL